MTVGVQVVLADSALASLPTSRLACPGCHRAVSGTVRCPGCRYCSVLCCSGLQSWYTVHCRLPVCGAACPGSSLHQQECAILAEADGTAQSVPAVKLSSICRLAARA